MCSKGSIVATVFANILSLLYNIKAIYKRDSFLPSKTIKFKSTYSVSQKNAIKIKYINSITL